MSFMAVYGDFGCRQDVKELKVRPGTDVHDYEVRIRAAQKFLAKVWQPQCLCQHVCLPCAAWQGMAR